MNKERRDRQKRAHIVRQLLTGGGDLEAMAQEMHTTTDELARLAEDVRVLRKLAGLHRLAELHTAMTLSRYRAVAAMKLATLMNAKSAETARKACVDLLKLAPVVAPGARANATVDDEDDGGASEVSIDDAVLLKLLGGADREEDAA